ncbi:hypothetical protein WICPIJ_001177 [Wickerhamomyces pijperi]|uniref:AMP deaminase n=1 Tax=Wickerhamomyces pijperi TaxID=599730 RepID=A0A9P8QC48_WICPI|nr:hypothetical protein WICPIJ_001177 [Wickerhamomyces pijperi]
MQSQPFNHTSEMDDVSNHVYTSPLSLEYEPEAEKSGLIDSLYEPGDSVSYPTHLRTRKITDLTPMHTIFDIQSQQGSFFIKESEAEDFSNFSESLTQFSAELVQCLHLRDKYQLLSGQVSHLNPVNWETWRTFPPPVPKFWHYVDEYGTKREGTDYYYDETAKAHYFGETFKFEDYEKFYYERKAKEREAQDPKQLRCGVNSKVQFNHKRHTYQFSNFTSDEKIPNFSEYFKDLNRITQLSLNQAGQSLSYRRLNYLEAKFDQYNLLNESREIEITKLNPHRDFYNVRKIDNNIDLSMCMSRKALVNVINEKLRVEPDRVVYVEGGVTLTLRELFKDYLGSEEEKQLSGKRLNIDDLFEFGIIDRNFETLDRSNSKSNQDQSNKVVVQDDTLVRIDRTFLRIDNHIGGEYLADLVKQVCSDYEKTKYQYGELGLNFNLIPTKTHSSRWESIADWVIDHKLISHNIKWIVRIPRNYTILRQLGHVTNFQEFLDALFKPLFLVSSDPESNLKLHYFLTKVSALDLLSGSFNKTSDISLFEHRNLKPPSQWTDDANPPYSYYLYYIFLNLSHLNEYRRSQGLNCLCLRNHISSLAEDVESGLGVITETLASNFLIGKTVINAEKLHNYPTLQYLYYLKQIGITMSPLCWNKRLQLLKNDDTNRTTLTNSSYESHPILRYFKTGMKVGLSTNKPLFSSLTRDPLIEEYSIANAIHKLGNVDVCELARNSVLISGFNGSLKKHWIGIQYCEDDNAAGLDYIENDEFTVQRSNVPDMRINFRKETLRLELQFVKKVAEGY